MAHARANEQRWPIEGTLRIVLTLNLRKKVFLTSKDDPDCLEYWSLRGGGAFAKWIRNVLLPRICRTTAQLELDEEASQLTELGYNAGLFSQYLVGYEILPTLRIAPSWQPEFALDEKSAKLVPVEPAGFREQIENEGRRRLLEGWDAWPVKRVRLSRYGMVQVVLEKPGSKPKEVIDFLKPVSSLNASLGLTDLARAVAERDSSYLPAVEKLMAQENVKERVLEIAVQWQIAQTILVWLLSAIHQTQEPEDLLFLDPGYLTNWRQREAPLPGHDLPLRTKFLVIQIDHFGPSTEPSLEPEDLDRQLRLVLAQLLEGNPFVVHPKAGLTLSPQRLDVLRNVIRDDMSTWQKEVCLLSHDTALVVGLHAPDLVMRLDCDINYRQYWQIVSRVFEYLTELRLLGRLLQYESSEWLEKVMSEVINPHGPKRWRKDTSTFTAAASTLVARLRSSSAPNTISPTDALLGKISATRGHFGLTDSIEHTDRNLAATQNFLFHSEGHKTWSAIVELNAGLAAFTAILMGLTVPPFLKEFVDTEFLKSGLWPWLGWTWVGLTVLLIGYAGKHAVSFHQTPLNRRRRSKRRLQKARPHQSKLHAKVEEVSRLHNGSLKSAPSFELTSADPTSPALRQKTTVRLAHDPVKETLVVEFDCKDDDPKGKPTRRDEPLWLDEAVGVLLSPGKGRPTKYVEFEVNSSTAVFDAVITNTGGRRADIAIQKTWNCQGLVWESSLVEDGWTARLEIPWHSILQIFGIKDVPRAWRANFFRVDRPRTKPAEFSSWSRAVSPFPDFHRPDDFGVLEIH